MEPKLETGVVVVEVDGVTEGKVGVEEVTGQGKQVWWLHSCVPSGEY